MHRKRKNNFQPLAFSLLFLLASASPCLAASYEKEIRPLFKQFCLGCHSTEKHKGDLDLERFTSLEEVMKHPKVWQAVVEQLSLGEMPPKEKPEPAEAQRARLLGWANGVLDEIALARSGDPGPVVLRRLSNAEYTYTIRDLTGIESLDPAKEFPADSASGEGFMNVGNLQGIRFDTKDGGVLPLDKYLAVLLNERAGGKKPSVVPAGLSAKYLKKLRET